MMDPGSESFDLLDGFDSPQDNLRPETSQRIIPHFKLVAVPTAFPKQLEKRIALCQCLVVFTQKTSIGRCRLCQSKVEITAAVFGRAFDNLRHLRHEDDRVEMTNGLIGGLLHAIKQNLLTQALSIQYACWLENETYFNTVPIFAALIFGNEPGNRQRIVFRLIKIDDLTDSMSLKGCEGGEEINSFQHTGLTLCIGSH